jgi:hypothetical protein
MVIVTDKKKKTKKTGGTLNGTLVPEFNISV